MHKKKMNQSKPHPVDASLYDETYYLEACEGYAQFTATKGRVLSDRLRLVLDYLDVHPGMRVLDIGCGRGELLIWLQQQGAEVWGIDYAYAALRLAQQALEFGDDPAVNEHSLIAANARELPFLNRAFDLVLMLDIVEHLHPWEFVVVCDEVVRVLKPDGRFIIHTAPNLWYYRFGYPVFRFIERLRGVRLPKNPRQRFAYHELVHVNEQSPLSLKRTLRQHGFQAKVHLMGQSVETNTHLMAWLARCVQQMPVLKWIFRNHIVAVARHNH